MAEQQQNPITDLGTIYFLDILFIDGDFLTKHSGKYSVTVNAKVNLVDNINQKQVVDTESVVLLQDELRPVNYFIDSLLIASEVMVQPSSKVESIINLKDELSKPVHSLPVSETVVELQDSFKYWLCGITVETAVELQDDLDYEITPYRGWQKKQPAPKDWTKK